MVFATNRNRTPKVRKNFGERIFHPIRRIVHQARTDAPHVKYLIVLVAILVVISMFVGQPIHVGFLPSPASIIR